MSGTAVFDFPVTNDALKGRVTTTLLTIPRGPERQHIHLMWNAPEVVAEREELLQARASLTSPEELEDFLENTFKQRRRAKAK